MVTPDRPQLGAFYHVDHEKWQPVYDYWGDATVYHQIQHMHAVKKTIVEELVVSASPDWWCNYCQSKGVCPVMGEGDWKSVFARLETATKLETPE
jgi:hypothetical protein